MPRSTSRLPSQTAAGRTTPRSRSSRAEAVPPPVVERPTAAGEGWRGGRAADRCACVCEDQLESHYPSRAHEHGGSPAWAGRERAHRLPPPLRNASSCASEPVMRSRSRSWSRNRRGVPPAVRICGGRVRRVSARGSGSAARWRLRKPEETTPGHGRERVRRVLRVAGPGIRFTAAKPAKTAPKGALGLSPLRALPRASEPTPVCPVHLLRRSRTRLGWKVSERWRQKIQAR